MLAIAEKKSTRAFVEMNQLQSGVREQCESNGFGQLMQLLLRLPGLSVKKA
jgi:hypothetical protein